jgi:CMP-N,N'-diacetyllegionaminic acid synthase
MMSTLQDIIAIIPARGGSKSLPWKNLKPLHNKPLIYYSILEARKSKFLSRIFVSTENGEIAQVAGSYGAEIISRPLKLARDDTPMISVCQHALDYLKHVEHISLNILVILQPTSPLRTALDIDEAVEKFLNTDCDSVVSVCEVECPPHWMYTLEGDKLRPVVKCGDKISRRQDAPKTYRLNGAVYVTNDHLIIKQNRLLGEDTRAYIMPPERSVDIDSEFDFKIAETLLKENEERKNS